MPRVFETKLSYLQSIERKIINGDILTVQYIFDETTEEAEKRLGLKICDQLLKETDGEIKGHIWKEWSENILDMGWHPVKEFIRERLGRYKEIKEG